MSDLVSKISASGLSAGVFLVWWPAHVTSQGGDALLARGVLWAAAFELLLLGFRPLERAVARALREREAAAVAPGRIGRALALALVAAAGPAVLLAGSPDTATPARAAAPKVIVKREIVRREVVVRRLSRVVRVPVPVAAAPSARPAAAVAAPMVRRTANTAARPAKTATTTAKPAAKAVSTAPAADTKSDVASPSAGTAPKPAATATAAQPTTTVAPEAAAAPTSGAPAGG